jgi:hypothetical protein
MPKQQKRRINRTPTQEAIENLTRERFAFLSDEKGFAPGPPDRTFYWTKYVYLGARVGVEVTIEFNRDYSILVDLIRTQDGQLLPDWTTYPVMRRWRNSVLLLFQTVPGASHDQLEQIMRLYHQLDPTNPETYDPLLRTVADQLRGAIDYLVSLPYETLFPSSA